MIRRLLFLLTAVISCTSLGHAWSTCVDGATCPENPEGKAIGDRDEKNCLVCGDYNKTDPDYIDWMENKFNSTSTTDWEEPATCNIYGSGCICRDVGETCYSDFGVVADLWIAGGLITFCYLSGLCVILLREMVTKRKKGSPASTMEKIVFQTMVACMMRGLWYVIIIPGRNASTVWGGAALEGILLKIPQLLWMGSFFFMASSWKKLFDQSQTMKKANPKEQEKLDRLCNRVNMGILGIVVPMYLAGTVGGILVLNALVNLITLILILALLSGSVTFGMKLVKELGTEGPPGVLGGVIKRCVLQAVTAALLMIIGLLLNLMGLTQSSANFTFAFWMMVHLPEIMAAHALLFTKISQRSSKIKEAKVSSTTTSTVTPEG